MLCRLIKGSATQAESFVATVPIRIVPCWPKLAGPLYLFSLSSKAGCPGEALSSSQIAETNPEGTDRWRQLCRKSFGGQWVSMSTTGITSSLSSLYLPGRDNNSKYLVAFLWGLNELICAEWLEQFPAHSKLWSVSSMARSNIFLMFMVRYWNSWSLGIVLSSHHISVLNYLSLVVMHMINLQLSSFNLVEFGHMLVSWLQPRNWGMSVISLLIPWFWVELGNSVLMLCYFYYWVMETLSPYAVLFLLLGNGKD